MNDAVWLGFCIFVAVTAYQWGAMVTRDADPDPLPRDLELRVRRFRSFDLRPVTERVREHFTIHAMPYDREREEEPI